MHSSRPVISRRDDRLRSELMLQIKRPMLHVGSLVIWVNAAYVLNRNVNRGCSSERIVERCWIYNYLLLERRIASHQIGFRETIGQLIVVQTIACPHGCGALLKRIPGEAYTRREVVASRRHGFTEG